MTAEEQIEIDRDDEVITIRMPRKDYLVMKQLIKERQTMNNITAILKASWVWVVVSGVLGCWYLWDKIRLSLLGA